MASQLALQRAAQAWCQPTTGHITMIPELAEAFAEILDEVWSQPYLGNASTGELLDEVRARVEVNGTLLYSTSGSAEKRLAREPKEIQPPWPPSGYYYGDEAAQMLLNVRQLVEDFKRSGKPGAGLLFVIPDFDPKHDRLVVLEEGNWYVERNHCPDEEE